MYPEDNDSYRSASTPAEESSTQSGSGSGPASTGGTASSPVDETSPPREDEVATQGTPNGMPSASATPEGPVRWRVPSPRFPPLPSEPPPPREPPPRCQGGDGCPRPTQGQCDCCRGHFCAHHFMGACMGCGAEPLCEPCVTQHHRCPLEPVPEAVTGTWQSSEAGLLPPPPPAPPWTSSSPELCVVCLIELSWPFAMCGLCGFYSHEECREAHWDRCWATTSTAQRLRLLPVEPMPVDVGRLPVPPMLPADDARAA